MKVLEYLAIGIYFLGVFQSLPKQVPDFSDITIEDKLIKPAIRMNIVQIAEQFAKLKDDNEFKILENFSPNDLKGISAVRNYIAHDYDSTDDNIIEDVIRYNLPVFKKTIVKILKS